MIERQPNSSPFPAFLLCLRRKESYWYVETRSPVSSIVSGLWCGSFGVFVLLSEGLLTRKIDSLFSVLLPFSPWFTNFDYNVQPPSTLDMIHQWILILIRFADKVVPLLQDYMTRIILAARNSCRMPTNIFPKVYAIYSLCKPKPTRYAAQYPTQAMQLMPNAHTPSCLSSSIVIIIPRVHSLIQQSIYQVIAHPSTSMTWTYR